MSDTAKAQLLLFAIGAGGLSWYLNSPWPVVGLGFVLGYWAVFRTSQLTAFLALSRSAPLPVDTVYVLSLEYSTAVFDRLGLTEDERGALLAAGGPPTRIIIERWGRSFTRFRTGCEGHSEEIIDVYPPDDNERVMLWGASLEGDFAAPRVELAYDSDEITLAGYGTRFGDLPGAVDYMGPVGFMRRFPLFDLKVPIGQVPDRATREYKYAELEKHLVPTDRDMPSEVAYFRVPGRDRYEHKDDSQGVWWFLTAYDLRPRLVGHVTRVRRTLRKREFRGVVVKLHHQHAFTVYAPPEVIERNDAGATVPKRGALVDVVIDVASSLDWLTVERLWHD